MTNFKFLFLSFLFLILSLNLFVEANEEIEKNEENEENEEGEYLFIFYRLFFWVIEESEESEEQEVQEGYDSLNNHHPRPPKPLILTCSKTTGYQKVDCLESAVEQLQFKIKEQELNIKQTNKAVNDLRDILRIQSIVLMSILGILGALVIFLFFFTLKRPQIENKTNVVSANGIVAPKQIISEPAKVISV
eukprot:TRINITY_DN354_c1_g1_i3.p1 TRINITY_DN354_c1_g1~~TRINITY_DN354_c1_g1_i3.p1  ORF type:complete len:206 (-),score=70.21 TRINITY_DN354_c1_g1_i3:186-758(-)